MKTRFTIFLDLDGSVFAHDKTTSQMASTWDEPALLEGSVDKVNEWNTEGYYIVITTGRKECYREFTQWQLRKAGIEYDQLVMNIGNHPRVVINDNKESEPVPKATAINIERNVGIGKVNL